MFIRKKDYRELCGRVSNLEGTVSSLSAALMRQKQADAAVHAEIKTVLRKSTDELTTAVNGCANANDITDVLFGFAQDIDELSGKVSEVQETVSDNSGAFQQERQFLAGLHSINSYTGVTKDEA